MKYTSKLKSGLGLLLIAGALTPLASLGAISTLSYGEGTVFENLRESQQHSSEMTSSSYSPHGAMGPIRTDGMETPYSYHEGALFDNLKKLQATNSMTHHGSMTHTDSMGAQGPTRTELMETRETASSYREGELFDNLMKNQSSQQSHNWQKSSY